MFRASKTLLCALAADVTLASRQTGTVMNVMDSIGSLLQTHETSANGAVRARVMNNLRELASITPGQKASLEEALTKVINEIDKDVVPKIKQGLTDTNNQITSVINDLETKTATANGREAAATEADGAWLTCVSELIDDFGAIAEAEKSQQSSRSSQGMACNIKDELAPFNSAPELSEFNCEFSLANNCKNQMTNYKQQVTDMISGLKNDMIAGREKFDAAAQECEVAKKETETAAQAHDGAKEAVQVKRGECQGHHETRLLAMCDFGTDLQRKCKSSKEFDDLIVEVRKENGGLYSQPDREQEWQTTQITKCMINAIIAGGEINQATLDDCEKNKIAFGDVDTTEALKKYEETKASFDCSKEGMRTITFKNRNYEYDREKEELTVEDIGEVVSPYAPEIHLSEGASPFDFCAAQPVRGKR